MSYAQVKPEYYRMHQPDSPWHAGAPGWKDAPWPGWGQNPNVVGQPRVGVEGLGAYFAPEYEKAIGSGLGLGAYFAPSYEKPIQPGIGACPCSARGYGDDAVVQGPVAIAGSKLPLYGSIAVIALLTGAAIYVATRP